MNSSIAFPAPPALIRQLGTHKYQVAADEMVERGLHRIKMYRWLNGNAFTSYLERDGDSFVEHRLYDNGDVCKMEVLFT